MFTPGIFIKTKEDRYIVTNDMWHGPVEVFNTVKGVFEDKPREEIFSDICVGATVTYTTDICVKSRGLIDNAFEIGAEDINSILKSAGVKTTTLTYDIKYQIFQIAVRHLGCDYEIEDGYKINVNGNWMAVNNLIRDKFLIAMSR